MFRGDKAVILANKAKVPPKSESPWIQRPAPEAPGLSLPWLRYWARQGHKPAQRCRKRQGREAGNHTYFYFLCSSGSVCCGYGQRWCDCKCWEPPCPMSLTVWKPRLGQAGHSDSCPCSFPGLDRPEVAEGRQLVCNVLDGSGHAYHYLKMK